MKGGDDTTMMKKKRKVIILNRDHTVVRRKKPIRELIKTGKLDKAEWVLIPIMSTSCTYLAVDRDTLLTQQFFTATIRFHLNFRVINGYRKNGESSLEKDEVRYDYYTTTMLATTPEELYQVLYQVGAYRYIQELFSTSDYADEFWYISVEDMEISLYNDRGKVIDHFQFNQHSEESDDVPFLYSRFADLARAMSTHFGLISPEDDMVLQNLYLEYKNGTMMWKQCNTPQDLTSNMRWIGVGNAKSKSFTVLNRDEYDQCLRMGNGAAFMTPISLYDFTNSFLYLPVCNAFSLPKYSFDTSFTDGEDTDAGLAVFEFFGPSIYDTFGFTIYDAEDIILLLDNCKTFLQVYQEGSKIILGECVNRDDIEHLNLEATTFLQITIGLENNRGTPADYNLIIYSDAFEDYIPNIKEVAYILQLESK